MPTRPSLAWPVAYMLLTLLLGVELLQPTRNLFRWDTLLYTLPVIQEAREQGLAGHWPFWSSSVCCGTPLLANINAGVLYPLRMLTWLFPLGAGLRLFVLAHLALSLFAMHGFLRRGLRLSMPAACVGALAYAAGGYARGMWDTYNLVALPWIPLGLAALLAAGRASVPPRRACLPALGAALCWWLMLVGGDFQAAFLWPAAAGLLCAVHPHRRRLLPTLGLALVVGGLLAAPQWLPTLHATQASYRADGMPWAEAVERSVNPVRFLELLVPHLFGPRGNWLGDALAAPQANQAQPWTASLHIGRLAFGLALFALSRHARAGVRWGAILAFAGGLLSMGGFLPGFKCWLSLPVLGSFRYPEKYLLWMSFGLAVLAAYGANALLASCRSGRRRLVFRWVRHWLVILVAGTALATMALTQLAVPPGRAWPWAFDLWIVLALVVAITSAGLAGVRARSGKTLATVLVALILIDNASSWFMERPTTSRFNPLAVPVAAEVIRSSDAPTGRILHDPAAVAAPAEVDLAALSIDERWVLLHRALLDFGSPVLWGLRSSGGFSPLESGRMQAFRERGAAPPGGRVPEAHLLLDFCRETGVTWLLTTATRGAELRALGLDAEAEAAWGPAGALTLLRVREAREAVCEPLPSAGTKATAPVSRAARLHRFRPGYFKVDLSEGGPAELVVRETWAAGWTARDQDGVRLALSESPRGMMRVPLGAGTTQVRFLYVPAGWRGGLWLGLCGLLLAGGVVLWAGGGWRAICGDRCSVVGVRGVVLPGALSIALAWGVGMGARAHWACTFDEGFHLARGLAALRTGDTRLNYFHPPLQNLLCAYFADQAFGARLQIPTRDPSWRQADIWSFACALADANRAIYPELVRASRLGSSLLLALLIGTSVWWAHRWRGPVAAWLTGLGLALNPALLAHGNLTTTDMGVAAFAVAGTALLWCAVRAPESRLLWGATLAFGLAAATKHSGVIWWTGYVLVAIPALAWRHRSWRPLLQIPFGLCVLMVLLLGLYGLQPQVVRGEPGGWLTGAVLPAGRFVEGLLGQEQHSLAGHRAYFHGTQLMRASWWYMPAALALKSPPLWVLASLVGTLALAWRGGRRHVVAWIPFLVFLVLLVFVNRLAIGVRHALPVVVFGVLAAAVWVGGLPAGRWRLGLAGALVAASLAAAGSYPHFISYYPSWAGGVQGGHRWMVDSNYDWGQDLEVLEARWADLTAAHAGRPPHLVYFGFIDPVAIYAMPVAEPSLRGFMGRTAHWRAGPEAHAAWVAALSQVSGTTVASISALLVEPYGADFSGLRAAPASGVIGNTLHLCRPAGAAHKPPVGTTAPLPGKTTEL